MSADGGLRGTPTLYGLRDLPAMTYDEWTEAVAHADLVVQSGPWMLVDLFAYGQRRFPNQYSQILPTAEEDPNAASQSRLKQAMWMASIYPTHESRYEGLDYTHHRIAAALEPEERTKLLQTAQRENLSTREIARRVKEVTEAIDVEPVILEPSRETDPSPSDEWMPTTDDLLPEHLDAIQGAALGLDLISPEGFTAGALWAWRYASNAALFKPDRWQGDE